MFLFIHRFNANSVAASRAALRLALCCGLALAFGFVHRPVAAQSNPAVADTPQTGASPDRATPAQKRAATNDFKSGMNLLGAKHHEKALGKFYASYGSVKSPNSRLMIVRTLAELGRNVKAYEEALAGEAEAKEAATKAAKYKDAHSAMVGELEAAKARVGLLTVQIRGDAPVGALVINGEVINEGSRQSAIAVVAGSTTVVLTTGEGETTEVVVVEAGQQATVTLGKKDASASISLAETSEPDESGFVYEGPDRVTLAAISGGVGALALLNVGIFGALSDGQLSRLETGCPDPNDCDPDLQGVAERGADFQVAANVSLVVGIIGLTAGAGLYAWDFYDKGGFDAEESATFRPRVQVGPGSVRFGGSF